MFGLSNNFNLKLDISFFIEEYIDENLDLLSSHESNLSKKGYLVRLASFLSKMLFHSNFFDTTSRFKNSNYIYAIGSSKKIAEQSAASELLKKINQQ